MKISYYKVGGCVRDELLGIPSKDIDYSVEAPSYEAMKQDIVDRGGQIYLETEEYGTIRAKFLGDDADFVLCRKDGIYKDGRRPDSVEIGTLYDDLARRDFTMNAIAQDEDGKLIDPFNGQKDLKERWIRCVGSVDRLHEDSLRMIRAIRFSATKNMYLDSDIVEILMTRPELIRNLPVERIREELMKMFEHDSLEAWKKLSLFPKIIEIVFGEYNLKLVPTIYRKK